MGSRPRRPRPVIFPRQTARAIEADKATVTRRPVASNDTTRKTRRGRTEVTSAWRPTPGLVLPVRTATNTKPRCHITVTSVTEEPFGPVTYTMAKKEASAKSHDRRRSWIETYDPQWLEQTITLLDFVSLPTPEPDLLSSITLAFLGITERAAKARLQRLRD